MTTKTNPTTDHAPTGGDIFPRQGISRLKTVCMITGLSKTTIYAWIKAGKFPAPLKPAPSVTVWKNSDVLDWIDALSHQDDNAPYHSTTKQ